VSSRFNVLLNLLFGGVLRPSEKSDTLPSAFYYVLGSALTMLIGTGDLLLGRGDLACICVLLVALGDPMASVFGRYYSTRCGAKAQGKTLAGSVAMLVVCIPITVAYLHVFHPLLGTSAGFLWAVIISFIASCTERYPPLGLDDNLVVPLVPCLCMTVLSWAMPVDFRNVAAVHG
jgi:dolichol kinase